MELRRSTLGSEVMEIMGEEGSRPGSSLVCHYKTLPLILSELKSYWSFLKGGVT